MNQEDAFLILMKGVEQFNQQEFYACHDTLEALWLEAAEPEKIFYQGILQIAVGCYHLSNQNWRGAVILLAEGSKKLKGYQPSYYDIDVTNFYHQSSKLLKHLQQIEPQQIGELLEQIQKSNQNSWPNIALVES